MIKGFETEFRVTLWIITFFLIIISGRSFGQDEYHNDKKFEEWSTLLLENKHKELVKSLEEELLKESPEEMAKVIWIQTLENIGNLDSSYKNLSVPLKNKLSTAFDIYKSKVTDLPHKYPVNKDSKINSWAELLLLISKIDNNVDRNYSYKIARKALRMRPNSFDAFFAIRREVKFVTKSRKEFREEYINGEFSYSETFQNYADGYLNKLASGHADSLRVIDGFLKEFPNDAAAWRIKGERHFALEQYELSNDAFEESFKLDPLTKNGKKSLLGLAKSNARLYKYKKLEEISSLLARLYHPNDSEVYKYYYWAKSLREAGDRGSARKVLEDAISAISDNPVLYFEYGNLEIQDKRYEQAISKLQKATMSEPDNLTYQEVLVEAFKETGRLTDAEKHYRILNDSNDSLTESLYILGSEIYSELEEHQLSIDVIKSALKWYPNSEQLYRVLALVNKRKENIDGAIKALKVSFQYSAPDEGSMNTLIALFNKKYKNDDMTVIEKINEILDDFYWVEEVWKAIAKIENDYDKKLEIWFRARGRNPGKIFPLVQLRHLYREKEAWIDIDKMYNSASEEINKYGGIQDKIDLHFEKAITKILKLRTTPLESEEWELANESLISYLSSGGFSAAYYQFAAELYLAKGNKEKAKELFAKQFYYRPDKYPVGLITKYEAGDLGFKYLTRYFERAPYDSDRLYSLVNFHVKYGGSPIAALVYSEIYTERFGVRLDGLEAMAYGQLGENAKDFEVRFQNKEALYPSYRFVDWYNFSRQQSWSGSADVKLDKKQREAIITLPNGVIVKRRDNILFGKIERLQIGPVYIESLYNEKGELISLQSSAGRKIEMKYNEDGKISDISDKGRDGDVINVAFKYNKIGKPTFIQISGVGTIEVDYDESGEIINVDSEGGYNTATKVYTIFNNLLELAEKFSRIDSFSYLNVPDIGVKDDVYENLLLEFKSKDSVIDNSSSIDSDLLNGWIDKSIALCNYMYSNISADESYGVKILEVTAKIINKAEKSKSKIDRDRVLEASKLYFDTLSLIRYNGVDEKNWEQWVEIKEWLEIEKVNEKQLTSYRINIENLQNYISDNPIQLLSDATWLPKSFIQNDGFWKRYSYDDFVPEQIRDGMFLTESFYRKNGDMLLGSNKGMAVLRKGYWEWMAFNDLKSGFQQELSERNIKGSSYITSFTESTNGDLFVGTLKGLIRIEKDYEEYGHIKYTEFDGLPGNNITSLTSVEDSVIIGTDKGAAYLKDGKFTHITDLDNSKVKILKSRSYNNSSSIYTEVLLGTEEGLYLARVTEENGPISFSKIFESSATDATLAPDGFVYLLIGKEVFRLLPHIDNEFYTSLKLSGSIVTSVADSVFGITTVPISENEEALAVMTDYGLSLYHKKHFEHFRLPLSDQNSWAKSLSRSSDGRAMTVVTEKGLLTFQLQYVKRTNNEVLDILTVDALGMTFVADGSNLKYILSEDSNETIRELTDFSNYANTTHLVVDDQNRLIVNNGRMLHRLTFDPNTKKLLTDEELFYCDQANETGFVSDEITSILLAKDGTLWVSAGEALFRYKRGADSPEEFNFFLDAQRFPSRSYKIDKVIETIDNRILVVASNEGHVHIDGIRMQGGLLEWHPQEERFLRTSENYSELGFNYFITGYTPITDELAIVGTLGGFAEDHQGNIKEYERTGSGVVNLSYDLIFKEQKSLFSGTKGAKLGNVWLFGSAAGVLVYQDGNWFFPHRFNQMLPDDMELSKYGSRHVNAISTDKNGKIYVGTSRGLAIYDFHGEDPMSFLFHHLDPANAFIYQNMEILQNERDIVISSIPEDSEMGKLLKKIKNEKDDIKQASRKVATIRQEQVRGPGNSSKIHQDDTLDDALKTLESKKKRHAELLLTLQQEEPSIYQLVTLPPLDLLASRKRMKENEAIIQYIPAKKSLFIQVLAKDKFFLREVKVSRNLLMNTSKEVHSLLSEDVGVRGSLLENDIKEKLSFLYDQLLKPIHSDIRQYKNIYVAPTQALYYVPFSALIKKVSPQEYKYAVEDMNIGYVSSMYLFNLIYNFEPSTSKVMLLMGDPDGSLPAARDEIETIEKVGLENFSFNKYLGFQSSSNNFKANAPSSRIIHLATHGNLDSHNAKDSWLLFADKKITMGEMFSMSMNNAELVTLSACQTGLGIDGMEYATLARAFTSAGAPTVLATLWEVEDKSANELFSKFYLFYSQGQSKFEALANAQRSMLSSGNPDFTRISRWSAVIPLGKN